MVHKLGREAKKKWRRLNSYDHLCAGVNMVYVDPIHNLFVVARWIEGDAMAEFVRLVLASNDDV